ncbi:hypothetical protein [Pseudobacter ginsenosidimutans]|uniref:Outer membrane protein with beta-barrel domain n=1 Tax=Pseudobacter ginsenosidimutans TaxID=661488 RepID=A0A4Q7MWD7_9BACT|nr:hypothetical protein [Pseudobacter ginsenosidimutans]QEC41825.1 hypothetical protein FSB84_09025 [Pseudobacter ginsenosidimutans]RZS71360.1 hypothetical protein EV199_3263 [Pseudobacter ginsenosidimutans]
MKSKYFLFFIIAIFAVTNSQAQIKKGSLLFGGSLSYGSQKSQISSFAEVKLKTVGIAPAFGWAVRDNLVFGLDLEYLSLDTDASNSPENSAKGAGVFLRKYWPLGNRFYVFAELRTGVRWSEVAGLTVPSLVNVKTEELNINATLKPGFAFSLNKKVQLETVLMPLITAQYRKIESTSKSWNGGSTTGNKKGFDVNTSLSNNTSFSLGVRILLEK